MARVHILGAGTPTPTPERFGSSFVAEVAGEKIMVDCGPAATHKLVQAGLWPTDIDYVFFTHHHFDHDVDFPCFLLCRWDQSIGKENTLQVFGPTLTEHLTYGIIGEDGVFAHDWKARVSHPASQQVHVNRGGTLPRKPPEVLAKDVEPGRIFSGRDWEMTSARAEHAQPWLDSLAYRIDSPRAASSSPATPSRAIQWWTSPGAPTSCSACAGTTRTPWRRTVRPTGSAVPWVRPAWPRRPG